MIGATRLLLMSRLAAALCWWLGCRPAYDHSCDLSPNYAVPCSRCGAPDTSYADRVGDSRHAAFVRWLHYWLLRRWVPACCGTCGKRYGRHDRCLPF